MRMRLPFALTIGAVAALSGPPASGQAPSGGAYTLTPVSYGMQLKTPDGRVVFDYMTKKPPMLRLSPLTVATNCCTGNA